MQFTCSSQVQPPGSFAGYAIHLRPPRQVKPDSYTVNDQPPPVRCLLSLIFPRKHQKIKRESQT